MPSIPYKGTLANRVEPGSTLFVITLESFNNKRNYVDFYITPL